MPTYTVNPYFKELSSAKQSMGRYLIVTVRTENIAHLNMLGNINRVHIGGFLGFQKLLLKFYLCRLVAGTPDYHNLF